MHVFHGQLVAIVQAGEKGGATQVKASAKGLKDGTLQLTMGK
jgi:beta-galactosidase